MTPEIEANSDRGSRIEAVLLAILGLSLPFNNFPFFVWRGFGIDSSHVAGGVFLLWCLARRRRRAARIDPVLVILAGAFLIIPLGTIAFARLSGFDVRAFWKTYVHLAFFLAVFLGISSAEVDRRQLVAVLVLLAAEAVILSGYGIYQMVALSRKWPSGFDFLNKYAWHTLRAHGYIWRATAVLEEPKWLAIVLLPSISYLYRIILAGTRSGRSDAVLAGVASITLVTLAIIGTGSLGCIPIVLLTILLSGIDYFRRVRRGISRRALLLGGVAVAVLLAGFLAYSRSTFQFVRLRVAAETGELGRAARSARTDYSSGFIYAENLRYGLAMFRESPLVGIGLGQFGPVGQGRGRELGYPARFNWAGVWVGLGGILAETGLLGLLLFGGILLRIAWIPRPADDAPRDDRIVAILLVVFVFLKETNAGFYIHFWTWFPSGIAALLARFARSSRNQGRALISSVGVVSSDSGLSERHPGR